MELDGSIRVCITVLATMADGILLDEPLTITTSLMCWRGCMARM
jgi:hypothetical protein